MITYVDNFPNRWNEAVFVAADGWQKLIPHVIYFQDFSNNVAKAIIEHANIPEKDVKDLWRRLVGMIALYYEGVGDEVKPMG
jgi:predicted Zn-dependent protease